MKFRIYFMLTVAMIISINANAQDSTRTKFKKQYYFSFGAYQPTVSTSLQLNGEKGPGAILSLEDNLGFSDKPWLFRFEGTANLTRRSGVQLSYVNLNRKQDWEVDRDVTIFDSTYHVGAKLGIFFNTTFVAASYRYTVFSQPKWQAGLSVGIRYLQIKTGIEVISERVDDYSESISIPAPVPVFGLYGEAFMTDRLRVRYNLDYFTISVSGIKGGVIDNRFALEYYFIKNLGLGGSLNVLSYKVQDVPLAENFDGKIKYSLNGFSFYLIGKF